jgi:hypothetical protein
LSALQVGETKDKSRGGEIYSSGICNYGIMMNKSKSRSGGETFYFKGGMRPEYTLLRGVERKNETEKANPSCGA